MMNFWNETKLAIDAARAAGSKIMAIYHYEFETEFKQDREEVTVADRASQDTISKFLRSSGLPILSEEQEDDLARVQAQRIWIVDPLDGTMDFIGKTGEFSVMIALVEAGTPVLGVIYQPATGRYYAAQKGEGAYLNQNGEWQKLWVSLVDQLSQAKAVVSRHHLSELDKRLARELNVREYVSQGSAGLKAGLVAAGTVELYLATTDKMKQWDTAAAHCLISEAGGRITDLWGREFVYNTEDLYHRDGVLMSNSKIHDEVLKIYKSLH